jgi:hypothetical protein
MAPPLIIVGTHVSSDTNDLAKFSAAAAVSNAEAAAVPAPVVAPLQKPVVAVPPINAPAAAVTAAQAANTGAPVTTNAPAATTSPAGDRDTRILTYVGVGLLGAAVALVIFLITRGRATARSSLITSSMQAERRPPEQK